LRQVHMILALVLPLATVVIIGIGLRFGRVKAYTVLALALAWSALVGLYVLDRQ
jgi:TRAP-type C4-dicarboxylate transport system permease large subunit